MNKTSFLQAEFTRSNADAESLTVPAVISSDSPVTRNGYVEILQHTQNSVDLSRFPLPLIESHDSRQVNIGIVENPQITGGKLRAVVRFGQSARAKEIFSDVQSGIVRGLSVGYEITDLNETQQGGELIVTATRWKPYETSVVSIPADINSGFNRSNFMEPKHQTPTPASENREPPVDFKRMELERRDTIRANVEPFSKQFPDLYRQCMDDMDITPQEASNLFLKAQGARAVPHNLPFYRHGSDDRSADFGGHSSTHVLDAMVDGLLIRSGIKLEKPHVAARDFAHTSLHEMCRVLLRGDRGFSDNSPAGLIKRAMTTSDLPYLLENVANKSLMLGFGEAPQTHDAFCNIVEVSDFKKQSRIAMSFIESLTATPEAGEVTYTSVDDLKESYVIQSYQKAIGFSRQSLINDDIGELVTIPQKLGAAARRTEADLVYSIFNTNPAMANAVTLFHASRGNLLTGAPSALSATSLASAVVVLRKAKDISNRGYLGLTPKWLIVPPELEITALQVLATLNNAKASSTAIPDSDFARLQVIVEPRLSSTTGWFLLASGVETIEVGRLTGNGISFETDNEFTTDTFNMKVRLDAGAKALSALGMVKSAGA
ncbi:MAG: hypothetical protein ABL919_08350 [Methylococcales bacterium]|nr:hypothetical protein [Methylococcaceae bacterium]